MKKIVKLTSLGLVALLASCGKNAELQKITPETAQIVAQVLANERDYEKEKFFLKNEEQRKNPTYNNNYLPVSAKTISADIVIKYNAELEDPTFGKMYDSVIINKHVYFDMERAFSHVHDEIITDTSESIKDSYPKIDFYLFFVEDKEQEEGVAEFDKTGTHYTLSNYDNIYKVMTSPPTEMTKSASLSIMNDPVLSDNQPILDDTRETPFDMRIALNSGLVSVTTNWTLMSHVYEDVCSAVLPTTDEVLLMQEYLRDSFSGLTGLTFSLKRFRESIKDLQDGSHFDYTFKSNDARSLGLETDLLKTINEPYAAGYTQKGTAKQTSSFTIKDLSLTDSHFLIANDIAITNSETGEILGSEKVNVTCDQTIKYNKVENDKIPEDYLDYIIIE